nr:hypothetical protein [Micromonospora craniellae]
MSDLGAEEVPGSHQDQQPLGPGDEHVHPLGVTEETQAIRGLFLIVADQTDRDDLGLVSLERVDGEEAVLYPLLSVRWRILRICCEYQTTIKENVPKL